MADGNSSTKVRPLFVYRLHVEYPDTPPPGQAVQIDVDEWREPRWPIAKRYLSQSGAETRARMLRGMGCKVTIERSEPVAFPQDHHG